MGYFRYRLKCLICNFEWNTFFSSVDMSQGAQNCPECKSTETKNVADDWKMDDGSWASERNKLKFD
jgi:hypothetical protein